MDGVFSRPVALRAGITSNQLRAKPYLSISRGLYLGPDGVPNLYNHCAALRDLLPLASAFSHTTAAGLTGLPLLGRNRSVLHVTVPAGSPRPSRRGLVAHHTELLPGDVIMVGELPATSPARTFLDHSALLSVEDLVALGDAILHCELATRDELARRVDAAKGRRGIRTAREALPLLDGRAQSVPESLLRARIHFSDLPDPEPQLEVRDGDRLVATVDLGYEEWRIAIEYEGRHHAENDDQFDYDVDRYTELESLGWHVLRATRKDLPNGSQGFLGRLRRTIERSVSAAAGGAKAASTHLSA